MKFCTQVGGGARKVRPLSLGVKSDDLFPYFAAIFNSRDAFSMGKSKYRSNKARGPIVAFKSSNDVPRERLQAQCCKIL